MDTPPLLLLGCALHPTVYTTIYRDSQVLVCQHYQPCPSDATICTPTHIVYDSYPGHSDRTIHLYFWLLHILKVSISLSLAHTFQNGIYINLTETLIKRKTEVYSLVPALARGYRCVFTMSIT